jgi:cellulose synthase (UDP-forming)
MIRNYLYGNVRWPWISELYEYLQSVYLFRAIIGVIINPRRPTFNVTAKGQSTAGDRLSEMSAPYFIIFAVLAATLGYSVYRYMTEPEIAGQLLIVGAWNLLNLIIAGAALGVISERRNDVSGIELPANMNVELAFGETTITGFVTQASAAGATVILPRSAALPLRKGDYGRLSLSTAPFGMIVTSMPVSVAMQPGHDSQTLALKFDLDAHHYPIVAELILRDMSDVRAIRAARQKRRSMIVSSFVFVGWALTCPIRALGLVMTGGSAHTGRQTQGQRSPANNNAAKAFNPANAKEGA